MTDQQEFDLCYVTSTELCQLLEISRGSLMKARKRGILPAPITINSSQIFLWKRVVIEANIAAWKFILQARRGELNAQE